VLLAKKDAKIKINSPKDINAYKVGVIRDDLGEKNVIEAGVDPKHIQQVPKIKSLMKMLNAGRLQVWAYSEINAFWQLKNNGFVPDQFETVYVFSERQGYIAFNKQTPDALVKQFQIALDEMRQPSDEGKSAIDKIMDAYIK
jgi:ABC-type amino acid transport substrate-binding protein